MLLIPCPSCIVRIRVGSQWAWPVRHTASGHGVYPGGRIWGVVYRRSTHPSAADAATDAARRIAAAIDQALVARGCAHVSLAGGSSPRAAYVTLASLVPDWSSVHLWFGDERAVPAEDPQSNHRLVVQSLVREGASGACLHRIRGELPVVEAARAYAEEMVRDIPADPDGTPVLDVAFLGLGEDGHTASLFPGDPLLEAAGGICRAVTAAPKPPPERVTVTMGVLNAARERILLATGAGKAGALARMAAGRDPAVPASLLRDEGTLLVVDAAALGGVGA